MDSFSTDTETQFFKLLFKLDFSDIGIGGFVHVFTDDFKISIASLDVPSLDINNFIARETFYSITRLIDMLFIFQEDGVDITTPDFIIKLENLDVGFGIDILRLEALKVEVLTQHKHIGHSLVSERNNSRYKRNISPEDLISRLGARIGLENITRLHPAKSNIPEKTYTTLSAAWSEPAKDWPKSKSYRPVQLWAPEIISAPDKIGRAHV